MESAALVWGWHSLMPKPRTPRPVPPPVLHLLPAAPSRTVLPERRKGRRFAGARDVIPSRSL